MDGVDEVETGSLKNREPRELLLVVTGTRNSKSSVPDLIQETQGDCAGRGVVCVIFDEDVFGGAPGKLLKSPDRIRAVVKHIHRVADVESAVSERQLLSVVEHGFSYPLSSARHLSSHDPLDQLRSLQTLC